MFTMSSKKTVLKVFIIIILAVFLLSTALVSVMYLSGNKNATNGTGDVLTGDISIETGVDSMGL